MKLTIGTKTQDGKAMTLDANYGDMATLNAVRVEGGRYQLAALIVSAVNSHEAAQRLAKATDNFLNTSKPGRLNELRAALVAFADEQQPEGK